MFNLLLNFIFRISVVGFPIVKVTESNGLEDLGGANVPIIAGNKFSVRFKPFQIQTFLINF